ncbi:hypothetical protein B566_EDAN001872 [Ephemera danica]|nr:hypothetical protein B566_EDAN001872 [Ephemera danica]
MREIAHSSSSFRSHKEKYANTEVKMALEKFRMECEPLDSRGIEKAKNELRETPEVREHEFQKLKKLIREEPGLIWNDSDDFLIVFLRPCHWHAESAFEMVEGLEVQSEEQYLKSNVINVIPERDQKGRRMLIVNVGGSWDPSKVNTDQLFRLLYMVHQAATLEPATQVNGVVVIMDFKGMGMKQVRAFTPGFSMRLLTFIQHAMPVRLKAVHIVKQPYVFNLVFQLFKPFIQEKLKSRMFFHGNNMKVLHEHISPECLPEDYGGKLPKINYGGNEWYPAILPFEDKIKAWHHYGYEKDLKK